MPNRTEHPASGELETNGASPLVPAGRVIGKPVYDPCGDRIGHVEDIAIDKRSGEVAYAMLTTGGFLTIGERFYPVPWRLLDYDNEKAGFVIPCTGQDLKGAPGFDREELSGWHVRRNRTDVDAYYGRWSVM